MKLQLYCRGCDSKLLSLMFTLGEQSLSSFPTPGGATLTGPLDMRLCAECGLAQLGHTFPGDLFYDWYGYRSGTNPMMVHALKELADEIAPHLKVGDGVLDVGSNDGTFLRLLNAPMIRRVGVDPVKNLGPNAKEGLHLFVNDYFKPEAMEREVNSYGKFKVITMLAMFYELEKPTEFLRDVRSLLADDGFIVIQMNYLMSMLEQNGYDNIVHEHQTYFSLDSLIPVIENAGFRVMDVESNDVNGGSFRVWAAPFLSSRTRPNGDQHIEAMLASEEKAGLFGPDPYRAFFSRISEERDHLRSIITKAHDSGAQVYVYGASTRGLAIMEFCGLDSSLIAGAAERNPDKFGRAYAGTGIPCVPEDEAREKADFFLVLPHHFLTNFVQREADWLAAGGVFIVPLPTVRLVGAGGVEVEQQAVLA